VRCYEHIVDNDAPKLDACRRQPFHIWLDSVTQWAKSRIASFPRPTEMYRKDACSGTKLYSNCTSDDLLGAYPKNKCIGYCTILFEHERCSPRPNASLSSTAFVPYSQLHAAYTTSTKAPVRFISKGACDSTRALRFVWYFAHT
jgi:hypothetical protein